MEKVWALSCGLTDNLISVSHLWLTWVLGVALGQGNLTSRQIRIWSLKGRGLIEAEIARNLDVTRQTVHKALDIANSKVSEALLETARTNRIKVENINPTNGVLVGYSPTFKTTAIITFSTRNRVQVWYKHKEHCETCDQTNACREILLSEAEERGIQLPEEKNSMSPSRIAEILFSKIEAITDA